MSRLNSVMPIVQTLKNMSQTPPRKIEFEKLWCPLTVVHFHFIGNIIDNQKCQGQRAKNYCFLFSVHLLFGGQRQNSHDQRLMMI